MTCTKCKKPIPEDAIFCPYCGKKQLTTPKPKTRRRVKGTGTIAHLSGRRRKPWIARMYVERNGQKERMTIGTYETKAQAEIALNNALIKGNITIMYNATLGDAYRLWSESHFPTITPKSVNSYEVAWRFLQPLEKIKLSELKTQHFQAIINNATEQGKSYSTVSKISLLASKLCVWGMQNDVVDKNYASFVKITAKKSAPKERFSDEELSKLWEYYHTTADLRVGLVLLLCYTGLRIDEFLSLKKEDYYDGCLHGGNKTDKGKNRIIPVPDAVIPIVERLMDSQGEYLYSSSAGTKYNTENFRKRVYYAALADVGYTAEQLKKRNPHTCRHTFASMCSKKNVDPKALQDIIGHAQIETTLNTYTHTDIEWLKAAIKDL